MGVCIIHDKIGYFKKYKCVCVCVSPIPYSTPILFLPLFFIVAIIFLISKNSFLISASFMICFLYDFACFSDLSEDIRISFQVFFWGLKYVSSGSDLLFILVVLFVLFVFFHYLAILVNEKLDGLYR